LIIVRASHNQVLHDDNHFAAFDGSFCARLSTIQFYRSETPSSLVVPVQSFNPPTDPQPEPLPGDPFEEAVVRVGQGQQNRALGCH
jgi:hypothetical protein